MAQRLAPQSPLRAADPGGPPGPRPAATQPALMPLLQAHALAPDDLSVSGKLLYFMLKTAHWDGLTEVLAQTLRQVFGARDANIALLCWPDLDVQPADLRAERRPITPHSTTPFAPARRWRVARRPGAGCDQGYLSSDLRHHAVGFQRMTGDGVEAHDRQRFEPSRVLHHPQTDRRPSAARIRAPSIISSTSTTWG